MENEIRDELYVCEVCGSPDLEVSAWVHLNDWVINDNEGPLDTVYCPECQEHSEHYCEVKNGFQSLAHLWCRAYHSARNAS